MKSNKKAKYLSVSALLSALSIVLMYAGSVLEILDLTTAALASMIVTFAVIEMNGIYPVLIYAVTAALSIILLPDKFGAMVYLVFAGYYPMLKRIFEQKLGRKKSMIPKLILFNAALTLIIFAWVYIFLQPEEFFYMYILAYAMGNAAFIIYDIALTRLITLYVFRLRKRLRIDRFFK